MDVISAIILSLLSIVTAVYFYFKHAFNYWKSRGIPYDEPSIPYGSIKGLGKSLGLFEITSKIYNKHKPSGAKLCGAFFFARPIAILLDLELVKSVFVKDFSNFVDRGGFYYNEEDDPLSANLFTLDADKWKKLRAKLTPTFTSGKMKFMFPTVVEVGNRFRDHLLELVRREIHLEMKELCERFTTDVIGACAFGIECNSLKNPNAEFRHFSRLEFEQPRRGALFTMLLNEFRSLGRKFHVKSVRDDVSTFFMNVIQDTVEYREKNNVNRNDFVDLLIKLKNQETTDKEQLITLNEIAAQAFLFFLAGLETSSTALSFCLYELALNTEIQTKARKLIKETFEKYDGEFTYKMMMEMTYIDQILEEILRKYPPGSILTRQAEKDYHVNGTDIIIEKGMTVVIPVHAIHHDAEYYPNPDVFDPDRFGIEEKRKRESMAWMPFGEGPRNCLGLRFGMMQARIGLISLLKDFEFSLCSRTNVPIVYNKTALVLSPESVYLTVKPINHE